MDFYYVYKSLAHPELDGYVAPLTLEERLAHIAEARERLGTRIPWLADTMANDLKRAFGDRPNSEFVIGPDGTVEVARTWSDPGALRADLAARVGEAEARTRPDAAALRAAAAPERSIPTGVVPPTPRPSGSRALRVEARDGPRETPLYLKLRAEAPPESLRGGGPLHLSFRLDPIHRVHWNNLADPMKFSVEAPPGVAVDPADAAAAPVEDAEADADAREFLLAVDLSGPPPEQPLLIRVDYFACDDEDRWCRAESQVFAVHLEFDRDGGTVRRSSRSRPAGAGPAARGTPSPARLIERMDRDGDGRISREEARGRLAERFDEIDADGNGYVTEEELREAFTRRR